MLPTSTPSAEKMKRSAANALAKQQADNNKAMILFIGYSSKRMFTKMFVPLRHQTL